VEAVLPSGNYFSRPDVVSYLLNDIEVHELGGAPRQTKFAIGSLRTLRARGKSHLMWVHYFEPHAPYKSHAEYSFGDSDWERYQSELALVDEHLSQLLQVLREEGWYEDSLILLFADHGESFGEHQHYHHHYLVYPWLVSVPFALRAPGLASGSFSGPVHLTDITPTVLQFLGLDAMRPMRGVPLLAGDPAPGRPLFSEEISVTGRTMLEYREHPVKDESAAMARFYRLEHGQGYVSKLAVAQNGLQLVQHRDSRAVELYDMERDPRAAHDLADAEPEATRRLSETLLALRRDMLMRSLCELKEPAP
jgi:arylsulfatase A-like enzyme